MALYAPYMLRIAIELARHDSAYEEMALTFLDHFINIGAAMDRVVEGEDNMWDEEDGFFYDVLRFPDGSGTRLKVRSLVGLLPLCATSVIDVDALEKLPRFKQRYEAIVRRKSELTENIACPAEAGVRDRRLLAVLDDVSRMQTKNDNGQASLVVNTVHVAVASAHSSASSMSTASVCICRGKGQSWPRAWPKRYR